MAIVFMVCATIGGTILACQFLMTLVGIGGHAFDVDVPHDVGHGIGDIGHDFGGDLHGGADVHHGGGLHGDAAHGHDAAQPQQHSSSHLFGVLSFRTVVAALTFFGLAGLASQEANLSPTNTLGVAVGAGAAAMYGVYWLMRGLYGLKTDGTVRIHGTIGRGGTVYLPIPAHNTGVGKIQINLQNRTMEYLAVTGGELLPTGAKVVVTNVVASDTLEVEPAEVLERSNHA